MPKVSVIIPVYNTEKYLQKCLDSVCNQTLSDIEIICINDVSTDNSLAILKEYAKKDNRIKLINFKENKGAAAARNTGIDEAQGEYIGFVDSDDFVDLDFYEKLYNKAKESDADVVRGNILEVRNGLKRYCFEDLARKIRKFKIHFNGLFVTAIYRKQFLFFNNINFTEQCEFGEDRLFVIESVTKANKVLVINDVYYNYVRHMESSSCLILLSKSKLFDYICSTKRVIDYLLLKNLSKTELLIVICSYIMQTIDILKEKPLEEELYLLLDYLCNERTKFDEYFKDCSQNLFKYISSKELNKILVEYETIEKKVNQKALLFSIRQKIKKNSTKIPPRIFYIWLGGEKTPIVNICLENWRDKIKDFEIIEVNENSKYFDFAKEYETCLWFKSVYDKKMWAYVSDYMRIKVLYDYGGVYLDTDMTIYRDLYPLLDNNLF